MELRIETDGQVELPGTCFVSVRCGDVQKQSKYCPTRVFKFPEKKHYGKLDLFKRIGSCDLILDDEDGSSNVFSVNVEDPSIQGLRLRCSKNVSDLTSNTPGQADGVSPLKNVSRKGSKNNSKPSSKAIAVSKYLEMHRIQEILQQAMKDLLKEMPEAPQRFLSDSILRTIPQTCSEAQLGSITSNADDSRPSSRVFQTPQPPAVPKPESSRPGSRAFQPPPPPPPPPTAPKVNRSRPGSRALCRKTVEAQPIPEKTVSVQEKAKNLLLQEPSKVSATIDEVMGSTQAKENAKKLFLQDARLVDAIVKKVFDSHYDYGRNEKEAGDRSVKEKAKTMLLQDPCKLTTSILETKCSSQVSRALADKAKKLIIQNSSTVDAAINTKVLQQGGGMHENTFKEKARKLFLESTSKVRAFIPEVKARNKAKELFLQDASLVNTAITAAVGSSQKAFDEAHATAKDEKKVARAFLLQDPDKLMEIIQEAKGATQVIRGKAKQLFLQDTSKLDAAIKEALGQSHAGSFVKTEDVPERAKSLFLQHPSKISAAIQEANGAAQVIRGNAKQLFLQDPSKVDSVIQEVLVLSHCGIIAKDKDVPERTKSLFLQHPSTVSAIIHEAKGTAQATRGKAKELFFQDESKVDSAIKKVLGMSPSCSVEVDKDVPERAKSLFHQHPDKVSTIIQEVNSATQVTMEKAKQLLYHDPSKVDSAIMEVLGLSQDKDVQAKAKSLILQHPNKVSTIIQEVNSGTQVTMEEAKQLFYHDPSKIDSAIKKVLGLSQDKDVPAKAKSLILQHPSMVSAIIQEAKGTAPVSRGKAKELFLQHPSKIDAAMKEVLGLSHHGSVDKVKDDVAQGAKSFFLQHPSKVSASIQEAKGATQSTTDDAKGIAKELFFQNPGKVDSAVQQVLGLQHDESATKEKDVKEKAKALFLQHGANILEARERIKQMLLQDCDKVQVAIEESKVAKSQSDHIPSTPSTQEGQDDSLSSVGHWSCSTLPQL
jgi:hypothetical protein